MKTDLQVVIDAATKSNNFQEFVTNLKDLTEKRDQLEIQIDKDFNRNNWP